MKNSDKKISLTGDRPTGPLHLGHYIGSLVSRVQMQDEYLQYIMIADQQALTDNFDNPKKIQDNISNVVRSYLAAGIDPNKSVIFLQSQISALAELTIYFLNLVTLARLQRNPTLKQEIFQKGYKNDIPAGFLCYPISQAADILGFNADVIPVGEDQLPMIEQANEIVDKFNRIYSCNIFKRVSAKLTNSSRLIGIDGKAKMSKSLGNAIYLCDSTEEIKKKVFAMYTDPGHIKVTDPGKVEGNVVFAYLDEFAPNKQEVEELKVQYRNGGLGDMVIKRLLHKHLESFISPMRERYFSVEDGEITRIIQSGNNKANIVASHMLNLAKKAIGLNIYA